MTTNIFLAAPINTADTDFRAWGSAVSTALAAVGLVKTSDTGQINWTTVLKPAAANSYQGYEIWRFNDTLQSTAPIFLKIDFGSGTSAPGNPGLRITVGKGSDGAGAITGTLLAATAIGAGTSSSTSSNWYMSSGDGSMLALAPAPATYLGSAGTNLWCLVVERSRNPAGAATGTGVLVVLQTASVNAPTKMINYATGNTITTNFFPAAVPGAVTLAGGGNTPLFPAIVSDGLGNFWQPRCVMVGIAGDLGALSSISVPGFGTYMPITGWNYYDAAVQATSRAAIWWQ